MGAAPSKIENTIAFFTNWRNNRNADYRNRRWITAPDPAPPLQRSEQVQHKTSFPNLRKSHLPTTISRYTTPYNLKLPYLILFVIPQIAHTAAWCQELIFRDPYDHTREVVRASAVWAWPHPQDDKGDLIWNVDIFLAVVKREIEIIMRDRYDFSKEKYDRLQLVIEEANGWEGLTMKEYCESHPVGTKVGSLFRAYKDHLVEKSQGKVVPPVPIVLLCYLAEFQHVEYKEDNGDDEPGDKAEWEEAMRHLGPSNISVLSGPISSGINSSHPSTSSITFSPSSEHPLPPPQRTLGPQTHTSRSPPRRRLHHRTTNSFSSLDLTPIVPHSPTPPPRTSQATRATRLPRVTPPLPTTPTLPAHDGYSDSQAETVTFQRPPSLGNLRLPPTEESTNTATNVPGTSAPNENRSSMQNRKVQESAASKDKPLSAVAESDVEHE